MIYPETHIHCRPNIDEIRLCESCGRILKDVADTENAGEIDSPEEAAPKIETGGAGKARSKAKVKTKTKTKAKSKQAAKTAKAKKAPKAKKTPKAKKAAKTAKGGKTKTKKR